jgi:hypothetical protein
MEVDFSKAEYENIEAVALSFIYVVILVLFIFNKTNDLAKKNKIRETRKMTDKDDHAQFLFNDWLEQMQNDLDCVRRETFSGFFSSFLLYIIVSELI